MSYRRDPWRDFNYALDRYEREIKNIHYSGALNPPTPSFPDRYFDYVKLPTGALSLAQAQSLLTERTSGPPHGYELLSPLPIPDLPKFPTRPEEPAPEHDGTSRAWWRSAPKLADPVPSANRYIVERAEKLQDRGRLLRKQFEDQYEREAAQLSTLKEGCTANEPSSIGLLMSISNIRHPLPEPLVAAFEFDIDLDSRIALCTFHIPDFRSLKIVKKRGASAKANWLPVSVGERKRACENILYSLCLRAAYLISKSDEGNWFDTVAVNAKQNWADAATGLPRTGIIASLQANKTQVSELRLDQVEPKACFRHLKGIATPSMEDVSAVRPIFVLNKDDHRIIKERNVADGLEPEANLAIMPWEDFEHLVRQLFEWEFGGVGVEVKVTRASRDRGVDAIMFDPDPLRGGKYVLQAKRYTRPVDVAAVRDLYGTVVNEGANRGILVTTSSYGPDAYEFAKDKPISLVDGPNLIAMLRKHGRRYRIDLVEARKLAASIGGIENINDTSQ